MMTRPALPHDAGSLVLVRRGPEGPEVLLGRRAGKHRFLPNVYAFPGGRVDSSDKSEVPINPLNSNDLLLQPTAVAAIRETWEETGIPLGLLEAGRLRPDLSGLHYLCRAITPAESPIRFHARFFLRDVTGMPLKLGGSGELLDLAFRPLDTALRLPLADITEFVLGMVGGLAPDLAPQRVAFWRYRRGKPMIRWDNP
ncbi:NUDIX domain-containing protein [Ferrovibrio terrae]|uniref:NUDIX domain-containing protein n=1 Tax=Ferrovibrio terrae TaxID=2594003 RepID=A0A516H4D7_9PROT|nr:NUDIX domain-containing protein [Ferrovibrio terrae]QDO98638.1 NUDIX domain-containing protein [Ferrovibrio terrae]